DPPSVISQNVLIDHLILRFAAPLSPDSLYYRLSLDDEEHLIFPPAYSPEFSFSTQVSHSGNYSIRSIDQNGLESFALTNSYTLSESEEDVLLIYPNPLRDPIAGKLIWKHQPGEKLSISIFNIKGQRVLHKAYPEDVWAGELALMDLNGITELVRGIYLVSLKNGNRSLRCKLTIL
ncbi:MAG: T9SS type A sorting domain-containing protein, partial [Candidatus Cloacimonetes bacterium]|nr:T9SS type A sorting domain-containing protein [Candidatus Cloacimonadota bacterium]